MQPELKGKGTVKLPMNCFRSAVQSDLRAFSDLSAQSLAYKPRSNPVKPISNASPEAVGEY
jgi:hypothetical protein